MAEETTSFDFFLLGTKIFQDVERNGRERPPLHGACRSCVLQVSPAGPDQGRYSEHDGAVWIDRQVYHLTSK